MLNEINKKRQEFCWKFHGELPNAIFLNKIGLKELFNAGPAEELGMTVSDLIGSKIFGMTIYECRDCKKFVLGIIIEDN